MKGGNCKRRESVKFVPKAFPYRISVTVTETGKTIKATKRRVIWRFGWSDSELAHEVCLKDSLLSGKKVIIEDGREVYQSKSSRFSFRHGWESPGGHIFRIESSEVEDLFTIDSIPYQNFEPKPITLAISEFSSLPESDVVDKIKRSPPKSEISGLSSPQSTERSSPQQKQHPLTFDPFDSSVQSSNSPDIFVSSLSQSSATSQNQNLSSAFDLFDPVIPSSQTQSYYDPFEAQSTSAPPLARAIPPQTHPCSPFDLFENSTSPAVEPTSSSPFDVFNSFDQFPQPAKTNATHFGILGSEECLPQQSGPFPQSNPRAISTSSFQPFDPFADLPSPESSEIPGFASQQAAAPVPLNPFETDTYPVFTSSSPDPFFSLSVK